MITYPKIKFDSWLRFTVDHNVEELRLQWEPRYIAESSKLPEFTYTNSPVTKMSFKVEL